MGGILGALYMFDKTFPIKAGVLIFMAGILLFVTFEAVTLILCESKHNYTMMHYTAKKWIAIYIKMNKEI